MDISAFRDRPSQKTVTVSELNNLIKGIFDSSSVLASVNVVGEISNFKAHSSGHLYFSLKDATGQIRAVMFRGAALSLRFAPENGMRVIVNGSVSVYPKDGSYQLYVTSMQPDGVGALYLAYEQLKARLAGEGLFSEAAKRLIPRYPSKIGVITSPTGAAVRDIINVITRRSPGVQIYLYPALVQGDGAEESLIRALDYFDRTMSVDTVIIGRGGGSIEDLWAFNSERLARRIYSATVPIISAVGHETDFTIADFVADMRAPTPSAAAELAVPDVREVGMRIVSAAQRCDNAIDRILSDGKEWLTDLASSDVYHDPTSIITPFSDALDALITNLSRSYVDLIKGERSRFALGVGRLEALNPLSVLARGYSVVEKCGAVVSDAKNISVGDTLDIRLASGGISATVTKIK